mmetsp:Transcript_16125/g.35432  ORF Transcript_16125/g.35432 Transcript_16125/m.35432 type:complete len:314 (-) Transcript_16125:58-999(-)
MPVERQVESVVRHFGVLSYSKQLRKSLPPNTLREHGTDEALIQLLRKCADLVAGNWVLKSELANFEGNEAWARDMLLFLFNKKDGKLTRTEYAAWEKAFVGTTSAARLEMTRQLAALDKDGEVMKLKNPPDLDFQRRFPDITAEFNLWWQKHRDKVIAASKSNTGSSDKSVANAWKRHRDDLLTEAKGALATGAMTTAELRRYMQKKNPKQVIREEEVQRALTEAAADFYQVRHVWLLGPTGNAANDKFRSTLVSLYKQRDAATKAEIVAEYERQHGERCKLSDYAVRVFLREIADKTEGENYVLKGALDSQH